ncbi:TM2 domain-containing protein [Paraburkholderia caledonica]|uniref:TM2 domain-containing protein n=1 Tax=Paraburkholderia caledonica TaxID=134536 RepID=UPI000B405CD7|nr:TM2 domain-containing protein [Paraburkholderia caledonica]
MSETAREMMMYDAQKKSVGVAYLLWFFLGTLGAHRFYAGRTGTAIVQLLLTIAGACTMLLGVGFFIVGCVGLWVLIDAFLLPGIIRSFNVTLANRFA